jgi:hypothetical protein
MNAMDWKKIDRTGGGLPEATDMTLKKMQWPGGAPAKIAIL